MITFNDASSLSPHFRDVCKKSIGLLRFCSPVNIVSLKTSSVDLRAEILANISNLTAKLKMYTDIIIKEQEQELFPLFNSILSGITKANTPAIKCENAMSLAKSRIESAVRQRISTEDSGIIISDYKSEIKNYLNEPMFRDAEAAYDIFDMIISMNTDQSVLSETVNRLKNSSVRFTSKHYNIALRIKSLIEDFLLKYENIVAIEDACDMALEIGKTYKNDPNALATFLDKNMYDITGEIREIYKKLKV